MSKLMTSYVSLSVPLFVLHFNSLIDVNKVASRGKSLIPVCCMGWPWSINKTFIDSCVKRKL